MTKSPMKLLEDLVKVTGAFAEAQDASQNLFNDMKDISVAFKNNDIEAASKLFEKAYADAEPAVYILSEKALPPLADIYEIIKNLVSNDIKNAKLQNEDNIQKANAILEQIKKLDEQNKINFKI